jgi:hypothetical protein
VSGCDHAEWGPACPVCSEPAVAICVGESEKPRRFLVVAIDVTHLSPDEIDRVQANAQAIDTERAICRVIDVA